eukprot:TRINITY_DN26216_c0_g1_i1.p1 TRINITY_DN26216_c0_g1~~TRINITY_DN26216_c0_g1_i1.p1  ORF type:complete len:893 (+),score=372.48 TRINITY_DN26216_c0_g1_i1:42-2720(+)
MANPFDAKLLTEVKVLDKACKFYDLSKLNDERVKKLPYTIRVVLETCIRNCDGLRVRECDIEKVLDWKNQQKKVEIPFCPARVLMQDFTGVPAVVDLAAMRDSMKAAGGDPLKVNPLVPVDLVIDHSVQVDFTRTPDALEKNEAKEFERNKERFTFLKWGSKAFNNLTVVPPGNGIVHQVNLEYLARVVFNEEGLLYSDSVVGTDSHTTMINGLGVLGWGVGGIEAEAGMLGQPSTMVLPTVVGYKLTGKLAEGVTATDLVLTIVANLRKHGVVGKFVEFYGEGLSSLSIADRATIANMAPEYGATCGYFPVDEQTLAYLATTGRSDEHIARVREYCKAQGMMNDATKDTGIEYPADEMLELDISTIVPCVSGPKRPHDRIVCAEMKDDFAKCMAPAGFKGFGVPEDKQTASAKLTFEGETYEINHGGVVIAAITSCTNTSNPSVLVAAGLVAKKANELGLTVRPYIKTSLSPGSQVVREYLSAAGLLDELAKQGFAVAGYGCMTCIGNSGELYEGVGPAFKDNGIVMSSVLSGNRNFEARVHPDTAGNYLASPPLVVAYALAGTMNINIQTDIIGVDKNGNNVFLKDIWPTHQEIADVCNKFVTAETFTSVYSKLKEGTKRWTDLDAPTDPVLYPWDPKSTYIHDPPYFKNSADHAKSDIKKAHVLLYLGDSVTTDHISPAGNIAKTSAAAKYLADNGVPQAEYNSYGSRRGNDLVMARGTFANTRLSNKLVSKAGNTGPVTVHIPSGEQMSVFDASAKYQEDGVPLVVIAGKEYGSGSSRDWAAKGPNLLGIKAVIAETYERIHRSNLVGMGIVPLCFKEGESAESLGIAGDETFDIALPEELAPGMDITVTTSKGLTFTAVLRFDTPVEITYYRSGGILHYVLKSMQSS